jgi:hypothetical protein
MYRAPPSLFHSSTMECGSGGVPASPEPLLFFHHIFTVVRIDLRTCSPPKAPNRAEAKLQRFPFMFRCTSFAVECVKSDSGINFRTKHFSSHFHSGSYHQSKTSPSQHRSTLKPTKTSSARQTALSSFLTTWHQVTILIVESA